jgi:hypothetical protein
VRLNMRRDWTTVRRDITELRSRFMKKIIMGLVAGSLFFNLPDEQKGIYFPFSPLLVLLLSHLLYSSPTPSLGRAHIFRQVYVRVWLFCSSRISFLRSVTLASSLPSTVIVRCSIPSVSTSTTLLRLTFYRKPS